VWGFLFLFLFSFNTQKTDVLKLCYREKQSEGSGLEATPVVPQTAQGSGLRQASSVVKGTGLEYWYEARFTSHVATDQVFKLSLTQFSRAQNGA